MADYKDIVGTAVRNNAGNLSDDQKDQIFYDSTNVDFKYRIANITSAAWASGGNMNTARGIFAGAGVQTAAIVFGGQGPSVPSDRIQIWNGTNWVMGNNMNTARHDLAGAGNSSTDALAFGGRGPGSSWFTSTEEWRGEGKLTEILSSS